MAVLAASVVVSGCLVNSVRSVTHRAVIERGQALVVFGVGLEAAWDYPSYSIKLDEYSLKDKKITGNCFHYNRMEATRPSTDRQVKYFAFLVPAGIYVFGAMGNSAAPTPAAYIAPAGGVVYFGDYIYLGNRTVEVRGNLAAAQTAVARIIPKQTHLSQAVAEPSVTHGTGFLCTP